MTITSDVIGFKTAEMYGFFSRSWTDHNRCDWVQDGEKTYKWTNTCTICGYRNRCDWALKG